jgi:hypothetical protein
VIATDVSHFLRFLFRRDFYVLGAARSRRAGGDHWEPDEARRNGEVSGPSVIEELKLSHRLPSDASARARGLILAALLLHAAGLAVPGLVRGRARAHALAPAAESVGLRKLSLAL